MCVGVCALASVCVCACVRVLMCVVCVDVSFVLFVFNRTDSTSSN